MKKILFVCTGNTCRSPMAEGFLRSLLENESSLSDFSSASAGISAYEGDTASKEAICAMQSDWSVDITGHRSAALTHEDIVNSFLVLTMTRSHRDSIISVFPEAKDKTYTLKEYADEKYGDPFIQQYDRSIDIPDPYGRPQSCYSQCAGEIKKAVEALAEKLKKSR